MKRMMLAAGALLLCAWAFAQNPEDLDRDRSKYATYSFSKDDKYKVETPYETVRVKQPKAKKVKNRHRPVAVERGLGSQRRRPEH